MSDTVAPKTMTQKDLTAIKEALVTAYPDKLGLYNLLLNSWGVRVSDYVNTVQPGVLAVDDLVEWANAQGRSHDLLSLTWKEKQNEVEPLQTVAARLLGFSSKIPPAWDQSRQRGPAIGDMQSAICRVLVNDKPRATGFLISKDLVLTTYSAVNDLVANEAGGEAIHLHFQGYGSLPGVTVNAAAGSGWLVAYRKYAVSDTDWLYEGEDQSATEALDFALIRLAGPAPNGRAVLPLPDPVPIAAVGDDVFILQHPEGRQLEVSPGKLTAYSLEGTRVHYSARTLPGSAGSPVLTADGGLIALHHVARYGISPSNLADQTVGRGVPIWRIRAALAESGIDLGAL
ncbi:trypsin-like peptidase domain-containing protein [Asticcacaulis benevestitus]|uniref:Effector-associated domain-containing protein n=1 Tax=Asticcacaulis benevestitus DSM 16100 = ATCC BAA-896 TaxID=1121022 RepID=V4PW75_9CAUL|nr:trypsin-like peptidase domain-containing protein [Asticcacaulis benevestitus]ESQ92601.1 hypothetical protein ABENE_08160 [Asticcacaulis benevestitus DSM 16100 = ATCC BAA-896]